VLIFTLNLLLILCCIILVIATYPPACSNGNTPLKFAIDWNKPDVVALLRSVGAQEWSHGSVRAADCKQS
jgi:hypothetical protein